MSGKAKKSQRQAYEARAKAKGNRMLTIRLNQAAARALDAICTEFDCVPRDVIERLLLGAAYEQPVADRVKAWSVQEHAYAHDNGLVIA